MNIMLSNIILQLCFLHMLVDSSLMNCQCPELTNTLRRLENILQQLLDKTNAPGDQGPTETLNKKSPEMGGCESTDTVMPSVSKCPNFTCPEDAKAVFKISRNLMSGTYPVPIPKCGKKYFFSDKFSSYAMAGERCCFNDMKLVSIETQEELTCLAELHKERKEKSFDFWTSASDLDYTGRFTWCETGKLLTSAAKWLVREPQLGSKRACVVVTFNSSNLAMTGLKCEDCRKQLRFMCEGS